MATKAKKKKVNAYEKVTNQVIKMIEKGIAPWRKTWKSSKFDVPTSMASGKPYQGYNYLWLSVAKADSGYTSNVWGTWRAIKKNGGVIEWEDFAAERQTVTYWNWIEVEKKDRNGVKRKETVPFIQSSDVVNLDCVTFPDGMPDKWETTDEEENTTPPLEVAEEIVKKYLADNKGLQLKHGGDKAFYMPSRDTIQMPKREKFEGNSEYYSTLFHEMGHSTGHKDRLSREGVTGINFFGSHEYSKEELVAEFTACFLCSHIGIEDTRENSAAYLKGWVSKLKDNPKMLIQASGKAKKAADYILGNKEVESK
tara:strand:+ start:193 stop:1122 length:930 start_codon:yes stop_codon:yes gene_type:complete